MIKLTVCIPTFNRPILLERAIQSVIDQDYLHKEIIISDNASEKSTAEIVNNIISRNKDITIIYQRHDNNIGMVANWQSCLSLITGTFYMILDDDNYIINNTYLSEVAELIKKDNDITLICANFIFKYPTYEKKEKFNLKEINSGIDIYRNYFNFKKQPQIFFVFLKTEISKKYDFYNENVVTHDVQSFLISMLIGKLGFIDKYVGIYDLTIGDNVCFNLADKWSDYIKYQKKILTAGISLGIKTKDLYKPFIRQILNGFWSYKRNPIIFIKYFKEVRKIYGVLPTFLLMVYSFFWGIITKITLND